jgi:hypothetical protein
MSVENTCFNAVINTQLLSNCVLIAWIDRGVIMCSFVDYFASAHWLLVCSILYFVTDSAAVQFTKGLRCL